MPLTLRYFARSDVGLLREGNEDSGYAGPYLLAIADGMGGHAAGEVASQAAIEELLHADHPPADSDQLDVLAAAIDAANDRIRQLAEADPAREGMGTTVTALLWTGSGLALGHIGDSRGYQLHDGSLTQITVDHTFVQALVDEGRITVEDAREHPARSVVTKVLQGQPAIDPDFSLLDVHAGDRFLLCSDGLSDVVLDDAIHDVLSTVHPVEAVADGLVEMALAAGAPDNVTVVVAEVVDTGDVQPQPDDTAEAYLVGAMAGNNEDGSGHVHRRSMASPDELENRRYAPRPPRRFRWLRRLAGAGAVAVVAWAGLSLAGGWVRDQYYVGNSSGQVAIYRGVSQEIGPIRLSELHDVPGGLPVQALPSVYRDQVGETITTADLDDAEEVIGTLRRRACRAHERVASEEAGPQGQAGTGWLGDEVGYPGLQCAQASP